MEITRVPNRILVIGCGGIGQRVLRELIKFIQYEETLAITSIVAIDGDDYQVENQARQFFHRIGPKAEVMVEGFTHKYPRLAPRLQFLNYYLTESNTNRSRTAGSILHNGDVIMLCVDNHFARLVISQAAREFDDIFLIDAANELLDGSVTVYWKENGVEHAPPLEEQHPEIALAQEYHAVQPGCEAIQLTDNAQVGIINEMMAALANATLLSYMTGDLTPGYSGCYFDSKARNKKGIIGPAVVQRTRQR